MNYKVPKFYGIQEIDFIYHGEWDDPEVKYKEQFFNYYELEESLYEIFNEENNDKEFGKWVFENKSKAFEILDILSESLTKRSGEESYDL